MAGLPLTPDEGLLERLQRSVEFMEHALAHVSGGSAIDRMVAVHGLDNAVEYLLRIVLDALDIEAKTQKNLDTIELASLFGEVHAFVRNEHDLRLPYRTEIKKLRQLRNLVQHGMVDPASELQPMATIVTRFYEYVFVNIFGLRPTDLRLSQLVRNSAVRVHLEKAEDRIAAGDYLETVVAARDAFDNAFYERRRYSTLRLNAIPVLLRAGEHKSQFFNELVDEIEQLRFGIDATRFQRFQEYVRHIPMDHRVEWRGNLVMQRPWQKEDAEFCYRFVAQTVMQWQNGDVPPLQKPDLSKLPDSSHRFGGVKLDGEAHLITYDLGSVMAGEIEVFLVDETTKEQLAGLPLNREYDYLEERRIGNDVESRFFLRVHLENRIVRLLTHNPGRWEVILHLEPVPLTWYRQDFEAGKLDYETPSINTADKEEIRGIYPDLINDEIAAEIVAVRGKQGTYRTRSDLEQVPGITDAQVSWICRFARADVARPLTPEGVPLL